MLSVVACCMLSWISLPKTAVNQEHILLLEHQRFQFRVSLVWRKFGGIQLLWNLVLFYHSRTREWAHKIPYDYCSFPTTPQESMWFSYILSKWAFMWFLIVFHSCIPKRPLYVTASPSLDVNSRLHITYFSKYTCANPQQTSTQKEMFRGIRHAVT